MTGAASGSRNKRKFYGDLINGFCYAIFTPVYFFLWHGEENHAQKLSAGFIVLAFAFTTVMSGLSYWFSSSWLSFLAFCGMSASIATMNLFRWPHSDEVVVVPQFFWSLLIASSNIPHHAVTQIFLTIIAVATASLVAHYNPTCNLEDQLPVLYGATTFHALLHGYRVYRSKESILFLSTNAARALLIATFCFIVARELWSMLNYDDHALKGGFNILRAGLIGLLGLVAAGAFESVELKKERLQHLLSKQHVAYSSQKSKLEAVEHALQCSATAMVITDSSQKIVWSNASFQKMVGSEKIDAGGDLMLLEALDCHSSDTPLVSSYEEKRRVNTELQLGQTYIDAEIAPFPTQRDDQFLVVLKDITSEKARETAERAAARQALVAQTMNDSMHNLSHELRTPLQGIIGMASVVLGESAVPPDVMESVSMIMASGRLLLTLINNMLDVKKSDASMLDFKVAPCRLNGSLREAITFCKPFAITTDVKVDLEHQTVDVEEAVLSNKLRFQQIMINLLSNAIKHSPSGGQVVVNYQMMTLDEAETLVANSLTTAPTNPSLVDEDLSQEAGDRVVVMMVSDNGTGIPEGGSERVFKLFAQVEEEPEDADSGQVGQPSGTGLGLNLCTKFVNRMGGKLWVSNNVPGSGCTFSFYLRVPLDNPKEPVRSTSFVNLPKVELADGAETSMSRFRVLVVDDIVMNLKVLKRMLVRMGMERVTTAESGEEALSILSDDDSFNLVLTDLQMPGMSGVDLCRKILENPNLPKPIVVGLTAETSEQTEAECRNVGMIRVLHKPITTSQLQDFFEKSPELSPTVHESTD